MYKLITTINLDGLEATNTVIRLSDNACIPFDPANTDYQEFLLWKSECNEPTPADSE